MPTKKKIVQKTGRKKVSKPKAARISKPARLVRQAHPKKAQGKPIGVITHFYGQIKVGIFKFNTTVKVGTRIQIVGAHTDFEQKMDSMQSDHQPVSAAKKNQQVGIKLKKKVHEGDEVFLAS